MHQNDTNTVYIVFPGWTFSICKHAMRCMTNKYVAQQHFEVVITFYPQGTGSLCTSSLPNCGLNKLLMQLCVNCTATSRRRSGKESHDLADNYPVHHRIHCRKLHKMRTKSDRKYIFWDAMRVEALHLLETALHKKVAQNDKYIRTSLWQREFCTQYPKELKIVEIFNCITQKEAVFQLVNYQFQRLKIQILYYRAILGASAYCMPM